MDKLPKEKWFTNTFFICFLAFCTNIDDMMAGFFALIAIVLAILQRKERRKIFDAMQAEADLYANKVNLGCERVKADTQKWVDDKKQWITEQEEEMQTKIDKAQNKVDTLTAKKKDLEKEIQLLSQEELALSVNVYEDPITSEECKNKLSLLKVQQNEFIKSSEAISIDSAFAKKVTNNNVKQLLRCFNAECASLLSNVTVKNADNLRGKLQKAFETINKIFETDGVALNHKLLEMKLEELTLLYNYELKKEQEKEEQKAIREQMLEEEKTRREIEREKAKIEKEEKQFQNEITKLMAYMQKSSEIEKQLYLDKIKELEEKLKLVEKDKENVLQREQNTRAGYVYVISNIGSFGEDVYKIGMTRRLEPMDRVKELGDASVPFEFDVHAMIFSEDAPALETILHQTFAKYMVNKVNPRKEFFKVPLEEIKKVVQENHNATVTFTMIAEAAQYRESLKLAANQ